LQNWGVVVVLAFVARTEEEGWGLVTGDKGPNTHWVHGENIEGIVNM